MTALANGRNTPSRDGNRYGVPVAAGKIIYPGALVAVDSSGYATPGATATGLMGIGRSEALADNSAGSAGDIVADIRPGIHRWENSASTDEITLSSLGHVCFMVDDQTVAKTNGGGTRSPAGLVIDVDSLGVWVDTRPFIAVSASGALLVANNLSDLANAATARNNLGVFLDHQGDPVIAAPGTETGDAITVSVQLKTIAGADLASRGAIRGYLAADANGDAVTGLTIASLANGTDGEVIPLDAGLTAFEAISEADGDIDIVIGCAGVGTCYLILITPRGKLIASSAITFA